MRAVLAFKEEVGLEAAEMMTQNTKRAWGIAKAAGDVGRGNAFDEIGAEGLVLALGGGGWFEKESSLWS
jgi:hypothetical protein